MTTEQIVIRSARSEDLGALGALAQLDSAEPLALPALLAEVNGEPRAARSLHSGAIVADPFFLTERIVVLLEVHAAQLSEPGRRRTDRRRSALKAAAAVWRGLSPRPALRA